MKTPIPQFEIDLYEKLIDRGMVSTTGVWTYPEIGVALKTIRQIDEQKYYLILSILGREYEAIL